MPRTLHDPNELPPKTGDRRIDPTLKKLRDSLAGRQTLVSEHRELTRDEHEAQRVDREALVDALENEKPDPGTPALDANKARRGEVERQIEAHDSLVTKLTAELGELLKTHGHEYLANRAAKTEEMAERLMLEIDAVRKTAGELGGHLAIQQWMDHYPQPWSKALSRGELASFAAGGDSRFSQIRNAAAQALSRQASDKLRTTDPLEWTKQEVGRRFGEGCSYRDSISRPPCGETHGLELVRPDGSLVTEPLLAGEIRADVRLLCSVHRQIADRVREEKALN